MNNSNKENITTKNNLLSSLYDFFWISRHYTIYPIVYFTIPVVIFSLCIYIIFHTPHIVHYISQKLVTFVQHSSFASSCKESILHYLTMNFSTLDLHFMVLGSYVMSLIVLGWLIVKIAKRIEDKTKHSILTIVLLFIIGVTIANLPAMLELAPPLFTTQAQ